MPRLSTLDWTFCFSLAIALVLYVLRGIGILSWLPGGPIVLAVAIATATGIFWILDKTR